MDSFREPLLASITDTAVNNYKMFNYGFSGKMSKPSGWDFKNNKWSVGGMASSIGLGRFGVGAAIGASAGAMLDSPYSAMAGAMIGGSAMWAAPAAAGFAARGALKGSYAIGDAMWNKGKSLLTSTSVESQAGKLAGTVGGNLAKGVLGLAAHAPVLNGILNPGNLVKEAADASKGLAGLEFTKLGKAYIGVGAAAGMINDAWQADKQIRMGQMDTNLRRPSPRVPDYSNNAGATGDLVFAMHKNRRG